MLHIAPEDCLEGRFKGLLGKSYLSGDLLNPRAMVSMDITDIDFPDQHFDAIYCSHVLEHVKDDRKAMREFFRVLKNDGWAILLVPITADRTFEDPSVTSWEDRERLFGQGDHVRRYGPDYVDRLRESGFQVKVFTVSDIAPDIDDRARMSLTSQGDEIYFCTKSA